MRSARFSLATAPCATSRPRAPARLSPECVRANCSNAGGPRSAPSGCGTSEACRTCGAVNAILAGLAGRSVSYECRVVTTGAEALDLRVWASPFRWNAGDYVLLVATDISNEKRRQVLERIFFHDLLNTANGIYGIAQLLSADSTGAGEFKDDLYGASEALVAEIKSQRMLLAAENNELRLERNPVRTLAALDRVTAIVGRQAVAAGKRIERAPESLDAELETDETLLARVLGNLLTNALEATAPGHAVRIGARGETGGVTFWCWNPAAMPPEVQSQVFQRNFSTKGRGHGLGTYSVKLLVERFLKGRVRFTSNEAAGTLFEVFLPHS